jgi:two-component system aerobic respiration control sensor histidine kinase ArcB
MSFKLLLSTERRRREAAEAENVRLRAQLAAIAENPAALRLPSPEAANSLAQIVTQLKYAEQQLEDQQGLVRQVIDNSPNLVYVEDERGQCILANKRYANLLAQKAVLVQPIETPVGFPEAPDHSANMLGADGTISFEECYRFEDDETVWYLTTKTPLVRNDGSRYLLTFSSDITDLKRAYRVAEESVRAKQLFMANMSHEIRTPLHGVMGLAELLKKTTMSSEQADYVEMIQFSIENLLVVINDILDFAKIESGQIRLESIPFDIIKTVQGAVRSLAFKTDEKGLMLRFEGLEQEMPLAKGDPFRLHQVLVNLLSNAIKFTQQGSITVTVSACPPDGVHLPVTFSVADTGIGISADNLETVFSSFRQADSSIPRLYGGTGLGLTICKNLVELQGGHIQVTSEVGRGSCFSFTIPYSVSEVELVKEPEVMQQVDLLQGLSVLLAEDNGVNQLIGVSMLGQWQVNVDMAQNGEEALIKAFQRKYDLILMDIQMPQVDGFEATARLRATEGPNQDTPIIALTADAIRVNAESCRTLGFTNYLIKPYSELALYKILTRTSQRTQTPPPPPAPATLTTVNNSGLHYDFLLLGKLANDAVFVRKMLEMFIERIPVQVQTLHDAIKREQWQIAAREAHSLKTTFGSMNIQPETTYLKKIEELAERQSPNQDFQPLIASVQEATALFTALFKEELAQSAQPA